MPLIPMQHSQSAAWNYRSGLQGGAAQGVLGNLSPFGCCAGVTGRKVGARPAAHPSGAARSPAVPSPPPSCPSPAAASRRLRWAARSRGHSASGVPPTASRRLASPPTYLEQQTVSKIRQPCGINVLPPGDHRTGHGQCDLGRRTRTGSASHC